jgi:hypothetical protein
MECTFLSKCMSFEVLTAVKLSVLHVTPGGLVGRYQRFGETYCLHLEVPLDCRRQHRHFPSAFCMNLTRGTNVVVEWLRIREVLDSNLFPETGYPH